MNLDITLQELKIQRKFDEIEYGRSHHTTEQDLYRREQEYLFEQEELKRMKEQKEIENRLQKQWLEDDIKETTSNLGIEKYTIEEIIYVDKIFLIFETEEDCNLYKLSVEDVGLTILSQAEFLATYYGKSNGSITARN